MSSRPGEIEAYNALATALSGSYRELAALRSGKNSWQEALADYRKSHSLEEEALGSANKELARSGCRVVLLEDEAYPELLREIPWPPLALYVLGHLPKEWPPTVAIVGTRRGTPAGKETAYRFAEVLARSGVAIVSGLALGIDSAAHRGTLAVSSGKTIAVLATGLDRIYPASHEALAKAIVEKGGAVLSEYPPGSPALPYRFLERNRIISGLSKGTLVVEAPKISGSLATARFAIEQNREVFVIPGPVGHPHFAGSHELIRSGAELVTEPAHILEAFGLESLDAPDEESASENPAEAKILAVLAGSAGPLPVDKIREATNLETHIVQQALSYLIIKNKIREIGFGYTRRLD